MPWSFPTTSTSFPAALVVNARSIRDWLTGVAENARGGSGTVASFSISNTFTTAMCCIWEAAESAASAGGGNPPDHVTYAGRVSNTMPLAKV